MKRLLFTLDYELFGNGSGDVFKHIIQPTNKLLETAGRYGMHFTFFFEVIEYWKIKDEWEKGNTMGYCKNPVEALENQIREACHQGHDIQMHLHPQWVDACWQDGKWAVNLDKWRLGGYTGDGEDSLENLFKKGKKTLEDLLRPVNPDYTCIALRAGGYNIQPSESIVTAMNTTRLFIDSSIYPGGKETGLLSNYDYTTIDPTLGAWRVGKHLEEFGETEILELPIVAFPMIRLKKYFTWERVLGILNNSKSAKNNLDAKTSTAEKKSRLKDKLQYFIQTEWQTWDYCLFSPGLHKDFLKRISTQDRDIFVLVGHPKSFTGERGLEYLLRQTYGKYNYDTISDIWNKNLY